MAIKLQTIVDAWETALATITTGNGYHTTVVTVGSYEARQYAAALLPAIDIRDVAGEAIQVSLGHDQGGADAAAEEHVASFEINLITNGTADTVRSLIMDVRKCVRDNLTATYNVVYRGHDVVIEQEEKRIVGAVMRFDVMYYTALLGEE